VVYIEKKHKIFPQKYYQNLWLANDMTIIGLPLGLIFGMLIDNIAFLAVGIPLGMSIGIAIGINLDNKAQKEGRQMDF
jgi:F0F1-type ATP synthase assembly protein I